MTAASWGLAVAPGMTGVRADPADDSSDGVSVFVDITPGSTPTPTPTSTASCGQEPCGPEQLGATGVDVVTTVVLAAALLVGGIVASIAARRRRGAIRR